MTMVPVCKNSSWEPFEWMNQMFKNWMPSPTRETGDDFFAPFRFSSPFDFAEVPAVDVEETEKDVIVRAEMPGLEKDDFHIELEQNSLVLRGEKQQKNEKKDRNVHRVECHYGSFERRVALPCEVISDKAQAEYKNGVLNITLPKAEPSLRKQIPIKIH